MWVPITTPQNDLDLTAQGFDTNASKVAGLILSFFWLITLWWARRSWVAYFSIAVTAAVLIVSPEAALGAPAD